MHLEFLIALTAGHFLGDFILQSDELADRKTEDNGALVLHVLIVAAATAVMLGSISLAAILAVLAVFATHLIIDTVKAWGRFTSFRAFMIDQTAHLAVIGLLTWLHWRMGGAYDGGYWTLLAEEHVKYVFAAIAFAAGGIACVYAGAIAVRIAMNELTDNGPPGADEGGKRIGYLERGLTFLLTIAGQFAAIGFIVAAKSILRFGDSNKARRHVEYVIIGTFMSFAWAISISLITRLALIALDIFPATPL